MLEHPTFGKLKYKPDDDVWVGRGQLPLFAAIARRPEPPPQTPEQDAELADQMQATAQSLEGMISQLFGAAGESMSAALGKELRKAMENSPPDPREEEREERRRQREEKAKAHLAKGHFPIRIVNSGSDAPTLEQEAAFRFLSEKEAAVLAAVQKEALRSYQSFYDDEYWRKIAGLKPVATVDELVNQFAVTDVQFTREHRGGFAHLVFDLDAEWMDDHGLLIVFSPDTQRVQWTTFDVLDDILEDGNEAPSAADGESDPEQEQRYQLQEAVFSGNAALARQLVAEGVSIDPVSAEDYPLIHMAIDQQDVGQVKLLLELGANPNVTEDLTDGKPRTPLYKARALARTMGLLPSKKKKEGEGLQAAMYGFVQQLVANDPNMKQMGQNVLEIIQLLEAAGGKIKADAE